MSASRFGAADDRLSRAVSAILDEVRSRPRLGRAHLSRANDSDPLLDYCDCRGLVCRFASRRAQAAAARFGFRDVEDVAAEVVDRLGSSRISHWLVTAIESVGDSW